MCLAAWDISIASLSDSMPDYPYKGDFQLNILSSIALVITPVEDDICHDNLRIIDSIQADCIIPGPSTVLALDHACISPVVCGCYGCKLPDYFFHLLNQLDSLFRFLEK